VYVQHASHAAQDGSVGPLLLLEELAELERFHVCEGVLVILVQDRGCDLFEVVRECMSDLEVH
jgi:hypothetical protein